MRRIPIVTFINKMDRDGRDALDLLDEIERVLGVPVSPAGCFSTTRSTGRS